MPPILHLSTATSLHFRRRFFVVVALLPYVLSSGLAAESPSGIDYNEQIKPILSDRCYFCHGPDAERREADLRLDIHEGVLAESTGEAPHIVTPGQPDQSELFLRITAEDESLRMPPAETKLSLTSEEIALIRQWIEQGAHWSEHWSFRRLPDHVPVPQASSSAWPRNEIDHFVLARMRSHELQPAPEADRATLIRRLSFDLTGLPPRLEYIDDFLQDSRPDAYERLVDRLLNSPAYGERMAAEWLDVARYSDTYGYQVDRDRFVWPWRDWVIGAFNRNLSYDQFITQQLAGDCLPNAGDDQILATTFNRLHPQKVEGGSVPEEFRVEYVADRSQTFATAFLGLTLECARCHDHKYDPIAHHEYYQICAFFDNIDEAGLYSYFTPTAVPTPALLLTDDESGRRIAQIEAQIEQAEQAIDEAMRQREAAFQRWLSADRASLLASLPAPADDGGGADELLIPGRVLRMDFEDFDGAPNRTVAGRWGHGVELTGDDGIETQVGNFRRDQPFTVALWVNSPGQKDRAVIYHRSRAWTDAASRGYELLLEDDRLSAALIHFWPGNAIRVRAVSPLPNRTWVHVAVTYDGSSRAEGLRIFVDGQPAEVEIVRDSLTKNITGGGGDTITLGQRFRDRGFAQGIVDEFQVFQRELMPIEVAQLSNRRALLDALAAPRDHLTTAQLGALRQYYFATVDGDCRQAGERLQQLRRQRGEVVDPIPEIMVMREMSTPRPTHVLRRGAYDAPGEIVEPRTPAFLPPLPPGAPANRLGLAQWLCDPHHPLTARVAVNRYWQLLFGEGLVRTPEDFGSQGRPPTHPDLLDWLARDFVQSRWDLKRLIRLMVMSATYRQSALADLQKRNADPENLWLARSPSYRWPAEMLRDNVLSVSGLLVSHVGGPPAKPYELEVAYSPIEREDGVGLYRRSLYTFWKRTGPAPVLMTLDASKRDVCRVRRERTSSPLQALVMLNGPQFVEAGHVLASRVTANCGDDRVAALRQLFRLLTGHHPDEKQLIAISQLYEWQYAYFDAHPQDRDAFLQVGATRLTDATNRTQVAALSVAASALFNYDLCMTRR